MPGVQEFLTQIAGHGTFLLLLLPVVGALLVAISAPLGTDVVRRTALTNVCLSVVIAVLMLVHFAVPSSGLRSQMAGEALLEGGLSQRDSDQNHDATNLESHRPPEDALLRISVGVDGISLWFVVLIPAIMIPMVRSVPASPDSAGMLSLLLLLESGLIGVFAATDALFFVVCLEWSGLLLFALIGRFGTPDHRRDVVPLTVAQLAGGLLVMFGLTALVLAHWRLTADGSAETNSLTFSALRLTSELPPAVRTDSPADSFREIAEPVIFWSLTIGFAIRSALFPFHGRFCDNGSPWPVAVRIPAYGILPCIAAFGFLRWVLPVCPAAAESAAGFLVVSSLGGAVVCALLALKESRLTRRVAYASVSHAGLAFAAVATQTAAGMIGGVLHLIGHVAGFAMLAVVTAAHDDRTASRGTAVLFFLAAIAVCGLPGLSGFPAQWLSLVGFLRFDESMETGVMNSVMAGVTSLLLAWVFLRAGFQIFLNSERDRPPEKAASANRSGSQKHITDTAALVIVLLAVGLGPQFVLDRLSPALRTVTPNATAEQAPSSAEDGP